LFNKPTELVARSYKRPTAAAHDAIVLTLLRIDDRWRVAKRTSKFLAHWFGLAELATLDPLAVHNG
jgi:hypothetical protein